MVIANRFFCVFTAEWKHFVDIEIKFCIHIMMLQTVLRMGKSKQKDHYWFVLKLILLCSHSHFPKVISSTSGYLVTGHQVVVPVGNKFNVKPSLM